jgi:SAM-dependent methyltransferase
MSYPFTGAVYDQVASDTDDLPFWRALVERAAGRVLELGVGTGRLALELAGLVAEYHGVENDPSMLEELRRKARERTCSLVVHEASFFDLGAAALGGAFDLAFIPANTISHVITHAEAEQFFAGARRICRSGGTFVVDTFNPRPQRLRGARYVFARFRESTEGEEVVVYSQPSYDHGNQITTNALQFYRGSDLLRTCDLRQRVYYPAELAAWLRWAGFGNVTFYGDYAHAELRSDSSRLIVIAA